LVTIPEAGHLPHQERPQAVLDAIGEDGRLPLATPDNGNGPAALER
jgi:hypothetical protein